MANKNSNFSILVDVDFDTKQVQSQLQKATRKLSIDVDSGQVRNAATDVKNLGSAMEDTSLTFNAANEIFRTTLDVITSMVDQVYAMDSALTEFKKVSDLSGQSLQQYTDYLAELGMTAGRTGSEMIEAATSFRKNGFNDADSAILGRLAVQFQNVSDEAITASESADFIISQLIAFNIEAENASRIVDSVNQVANEFSVSSGELARGLGIVASTSSAMGNSMEQTLGMITAVSEQTRNVNRSSRALNTIFSRLSQVLDDASSTGAALTQIYNDLGIALYDAEGQMRPMYDILGELAGQWDTLDTNTQQYIALTSAGMKVPLQGKLTGTALELWIPNHNRNVMVA